jgi:hypothetical protein
VVGLTYCILAAVLACGALVWIDHATHWPSRLFEREVARALEVWQPADDTERWIQAGGDRTFCEFVEQRDGASAAAAQQNTIQGYYAGSSPHNYAAPGSSSLNTYTARTSMAGLHHAWNHLFAGALQGAIGGPVGGGLGSAYRASRQGARQQAGIVEAAFASLQADAKRRKRLPQIDAQRQWEVQPEDDFFDGDAG